MDQQGGTAVAEPSASAGLAPWRARRGVQTLRTEPRVLQAPRPAGSLAARHPIPLEKVARTRVVRILHS